MQENYLCLSSKRTFPDIQAEVVMNEIPADLINPRRACARVTVVVLCVCVCVCVSPRL